MRQANIANFAGAALGMASFLSGLAMSVVSVAADPREAGIWYDDTGKGAVKIEICTSTTLCGKIYWLKEPLNAKGEPKTDKNNPEPSMQNRPVCGLKVLGDLEQLSEGGFDNGWVYDPKEGKSYDVALDLIAADQLKVTGYKGMRFLGKSFIWTRAPADLPSCAADAASNGDKSNDGKSKEAKSKDAKAKVAKAKDGKENASASTGTKAASATKVGAASAAPAKKKSKTTEPAATQQPPVASN